MSECPVGVRTVHVPLTAQNTGLVSYLLAPAGNEITLLNSVTGFGLKFTKSVAKSIEHIKLIAESPKFCKDASPYSEIETLNS